jgi:hypothetical protein
LKYDTLILSFAHPSLELSYAAVPRAAAIASKISTAAIFALGSVNGGIAAKTERLVVIPDHQVGLAANWTVKCASEAVWGIGVPIKVWVPSRIRTDLQILADHVGIKLSQYVREIVISRLLGHGTLPLRPAMLVATPLPSAEQWCEGQEVSMRQVNEDEYRQCEERKRQTEWV